jgi:hypothetical protein
MTNVPYKLNMVVEPLCRSGCHLSRNVTWDARQDLSSSEQQSSSTDTSLIGDDVRLAILDNRLPSSYGPFKGLYQEIPAFF